MARRIGLTMRVEQAAGFSEVRDCLAQDWYSFMTYALPEVSWVPIPNVGPGVIDYIRSWELDGFILTGGNDLGEVSQRDETEQVLLEHAISSQLPVFGVCRGLQVVQHYHGGAVETCRREDHVATLHPVTFTEHARRFEQAGSVRQVNSFHTQGVSVSGLASPLLPFAVTEDGWVEGVIHPANNLLAGVQWHPERTQPVSEMDKVILRTCLGLESR